MGTGGNDDQRAVHYTFGDGCNHRIDIIQTAVQCIDSRFKLQNFAVFTACAFSVIGRLFRSSSKCHGLLSIGLVLLQL
jgi:hypothetical protein